MKSRFSFSGNQLKLLAALFMIVDHVGLLFFPSALVLRAIGRLSFPIFAFFIAEGCKYTKNKVRYFITMALCGAVSQAVYYIFAESLKMCVFVTFTVSIALIYAIYGVKNAIFSKAPTRVKLLLSILVAVAVFGTVVFVVSFFDIDLDYGVSGAMVPVIISLAHKPKNAPEYWDKIDTPPVVFALFALGTAILCIGMPGIQLFSLLSLVPISLYSGNRGKAKLKYFFYLFYPLHLVILWGIFYLTSK